jgi:signal transduction histidine kinase
MDSLITDALNYNRTVRQELALAPVDAGRLLRGMVDTYPELQPSRAQIEIEGEIPLVMGNEAGLTQCFSNLLGNAVKFAKPGQTPRIRIWAELRNAECRIQNAECGNEHPESRIQHPASSPTEHAPRNTTPHSALGTVRIWIEDNGIGIPEPMLPRVFDMFARGHQGYEGTGIGLALVRKVMDRMGGKVGVESEEGKGSRFWLDLKPGDVRSRR